MDSAHGVLWSDTISDLFHSTPGSALEARLQFSRMALVPAALANWPGLLGTPGLIQLALLVTALALCHRRLRESDLEGITKLGVWIAAYVAATLATNFAIVAWLSRGAP